jgi:acyl carrier protein
MARKRVSIVYQIAEKLHRRRPKLKGRRTGIMTHSPLCCDGSSPLLASIWIELLGVTTVSPDDNFIELGGNSLSATILATRLEEETGVTVAIQDIFQLTFSELADRFRA